MRLPGEISRKFRQIHEDSNGVDAFWNCLVYLPLFESASVWADTLPRSVDSISEFETISRVFVLFTHYIRIFLDTDILD